MGPCFPNSFCGCKGGAGILTSRSLGDVLVGSKSAAKHPPTHMQGLSSLSHRNDNYSRPPLCSQSTAPAPHNQGHYFLEEGYCLPGLHQGNGAALGQRPESRVLHVPRGTAVAGAGVRGRALRVCQMKILWFLRANSF